MTKNTCINKLYRFWNKVVSAFHCIYYGCPPNNNRVSGITKLSLYDLRWILGAQLQTKVISLYNQLRNVPEKFLLTRSILFLKCFTYYRLGYKCQMLSKLFDFQLCSALQLFWTYNKHYPLKLTFYLKKI